MIVTRSTNCEDGDEKVRNSLKRAVRSGAAGAVAISFNVFSLVFRLPLPDYQFTTLGIFFRMAETLRSLSIILLIDVAPYSNFSPVQIWFKHRSHIS